MSESKKNPENSSEMELRECKTCKIVQPLSNYAKHGKSNSDKVYHKYICRKCFSSSRKEYSLKRYKKKERPKKYKKEPKEEKELYKLTISDDNKDDFVIKNIKHIIRLKKKKDNSWLVVLDEKI